MSVTRAAYDASFTKLVSLVAYRDSRRSENQRTLRDLFHWLARFIFLNCAQHQWEFFGRLGAAWELPPPSDK